MKVKLIGKTQVVNLILPTKIYGNYWITNENKENLINIEAKDNNWFIKSNNDIKIMEGGNVISELPLEENKFYNFFDITKEEKYRIFVSSTFDSKMLLLEINEEGDFTFYIGNSEQEETNNLNYISYSNDRLSYNQIEIKKTNELYHIKNLDEKNNLYVNNYLTKESYLKYGDVVFIEGLTFSFVGKILMLGTVDNKVKYASNKFTLKENVKLDFNSINQSSDVNVELYNKNDYFVRPPRFNEIITTKEFNIDNPPKKQTDESLQVILTLGPMLVMGMSSSVTGALAFIKVMNGESTWKESLSSIITACCMIIAMLVFPMVSKAYQKHRAKKKEKLRQSKYGEYLKNVEKSIKEEITRQTRILEENNISLKDTGDIILYKKRNLWERKIEHNDFLTLRLGIGNIKPDIKVNYQKEHFELETDNLEQSLRNIIINNNIIENVPVTLSFRDKYISSLIGKYNTLIHYLDGLILQMMAYQSYDELKLVIFTNKENISSYEKLKNSPYLWNDDKSIRFFASNIDEMTLISNELESIYNERKQKENTNIFPVHYLIITDDIENTNKIGIINDILKSDKSLGFSLLYLTDKLNSLPSECSTFISIDKSIGGVFENELNNKKQEFIPDFTQTTIDTYIFGASNIPIEISGKSFELPTVYSFLEMYDAGNVEQLNAYNLWQKNDPTISLSCPVGLSENGEVFKLDIHEKVHGPHGLIAGMTGSGKSEFIITYILSMAVNYHPNEVQFVLIDYKGGGLAGAFENKETGEKLPHLAGTITNLDANEINRSLSSLQSELKRRQKIFNEARDKCGESTVDIYKYQKLYREKKVDEPVAHLIIISDEFAELKDQQPEFMDELISAARIGRSLGVHLILATQKPSGVVDEQIWSNAKFRICLKVQDKNDSNDMLKQPDAAYLKETGRFYLQVGYNEFFAKGQSAWCGAKYFESDKRKKLVDNSISFVDNTGSKIKNIDNDNQNNRGIQKGEELTNVLNYLKQLGKTENIEVKKLWLDQIPETILVDNLKKKYNYQKENFKINPVIGEYDAPLEQRQNILTLPFSNFGNLLIYGMVGSGKENLLSTITYSLASTYTPKEVNIYILDFGTEQLRMYAKAPQVGDIVNSIEEDKIKTLFKLLEFKINERKKLFADYNGSYENFCKNSGQTVPTVITIINGFESFNEQYDTLADELILLTREGQKYGVLFILTVSSPNNIRMKLSQNFNEKLVLQMNDEFDYRQILGRTDVVPSKLMGRGLVLRENIYEFQTACPEHISSVNTFIQQTVEKLNQIYTKKAMRIPTLPEVVTTDYLSPSLDGLNKIPVGVEKDTLNISTVDLKNQLSLLVTSMQVSQTNNFVKSFVYELSNIKNNVTYVIDAERLLESCPNNVKYFATSFEKIFESFKSIVETLNNEYTQNDYNINSLNKYADMTFVIIGINKIKTILGASFDSLVATPMQLSKKMSKIRYVIIDTFDNLKKLEYDNWYKDIVNSTRGIWIGNGLAETSVFKINVSTRSISGNIPSNFGYNIVSGIPRLIKYVESTGDVESL